MIIDSSAIVAMLLREPEAEIFGRLVAADPAPRLSAASFLETSMVLISRLGDAAEDEIDALIEGFDLQIVPFDAQQARIARAAFRRFGKRRHAANPTLGNCFAYALAKVTGEPLLFKGTDFGRTDVEPLGAASA